MTYDSFVGLPRIFVLLVSFRNLNLEVKEKSTSGGARKDFYSLSAILKSFSLVVEKYFVMDGGQGISKTNGIHEMLMVDVPSARI